MVPDAEPGGGRVRIFSEKLDFRRKARPRVDDDNLDHAPGGGQVRIAQDHPPVGWRGTSLGNVPDGSEGTV